MQNLFKLILKGTAVEKIPSSIEGLVGLTVEGMYSHKSLSSQIFMQRSSSQTCQAARGGGVFRELELSESAMRELLVFMKHQKYLSFCGSSTSRDALSSMLWVQRVVLINIGRGPHGDEPAGWPVRWEYSSKQRVGNLLGSLLLFGIGRVQLFLGDFLNS
ncbi:unnamed protein product [Prunus armeniaca]